MRSEIRRNRRDEWFFRCRRCKQRGLPHYWQISALGDRDRHECEGKQ